MSIPFGLDKAAALERKRAREKLGEPAAESTRPRLNPPFPWEASGPEDLGLLGILASPQGTGEEPPALTLPGE